jgi:epsilon-lactone hydrolase
LSNSELEHLLDLFKAQPAAETQALDKLRARIDRFAKAFPCPDGVTVDAVELGGVPCERLGGGTKSGAILYFHGGGFAIGSPASHRHLAGQLAADTGMTVWTVDFRRAPEAPYPAALDDAVSAYRAILQSIPAARIVLAGDSAGGGLAFSTLLRARAESMPMPSSIVALSPWVNLSSDNPKFASLAELDFVTSRASSDFFARMYASAALHSDPLVSPIHGHLTGLPPVLIQAASHEVFLGDIQLFAERLSAAGVATTFDIWPEMFHVWHLYWPMLQQGREAIQRAAEFIVGHRAAG